MRLLDLIRDIGDVKCSRSEALRRLMKATNYWEPFLLRRKKIDARGVALEHADERAERGEGEHEHEDAVDQKENDVESER